MIQHIVLFSLKPVSCVYQTNSHHVTVVQELRKGGSTVSILHFVGLRGLAT